MNYGKLFVVTLHTANVVCLISAIIGLMLTLWRINEIIGCTFTIIVALVGILNAFSTHFMAFAIFGILAIIDTLFILINAILLIVTGYKWQKYCDGDSGTTMGDTDWSCHDFRHNSYGAYIVALSIFLLIGFIFRLITVACIGLLFYYDEDRDDESKD